MNGSGQWNGGGSILFTVTNRTSPHANPDSDRHAEHLVEVAIAGFPVTERLAPAKIDTVRSGPTSFVHHERSGEQRHEMIETDGHHT